jgi:tetratricopeptide (TPR) repeat protein
MIEGRAGQERELPALPEEQAEFGPLLRQRPMSMSLLQMQKLISTEVGEYPQGAELRQQQDEMDEFQRQLKLFDDKMDRLRQDLRAEGSQPESLKWEGTTQPTGRWPAQAEKPTLEEPGKLFEAEKPETEGTEPQVSPLQSSPDVYEQMKRQVLMWQEGGQAWPAGTEEPAKEAIEDERELDQEKSLLGLEDLLDRPVLARQQVWESPLERPAADQQADLSGADRVILGSYKSFAGRTEDKFNQYMRAGEEYLKQGKFYRAVDAYTLASIFKAQDPLAYAGKSHALFAAGEYVSSALFLSRALEIFPEYARFKVDLVSMIGDKDQLDNRIADIKEWLKQSDAGELHFLLGYIYYQMGRADLAKKEIYATYKKMPDSPAVQAMKEIVDALIPGEPVVEETIGEETVGEETSEEEAMEKAVEKAVGEEPAEEEDPQKKWW